MKKLTARALALAAALCAGGAILAAGPAFAQAKNPAFVLNEQAVLRDPEVPVLGNPEGDVTIVEYFDYQCPYCRKVHPDLMRLVAEDGKLRLVLKDWPIFGPNSQLAARAALAAKRQGKYAEMHAALMRTTGKLDPDKIRAAAGEAGVDLDKLNADMQAHGGAIEAVLERNGEQADALNLTGTPAFLIGPFLVAGAPSLDEMKRAVSQSRARAKKPAPKS